MTAADLPAENDAQAVEDCARGPEWFRCIYLSGHDDDCFGYRIIPPAKPEAAR